jgi:LPXTG-motif cell wall-anchored protein
VGYFGPNFKIMDSGTIVPEPGAIAFGVLAAGSVLGLVARKRRKA